MRDHDKMKDEAIAHLSDQLIAIMEDYKNLREGN